MAEEQSFCEDFESSLSDLTFNSKPLINMLTMLAEENAAYATHVVRLIEARLNKAKSTEKLPVLYLLDSILKNISRTYQSLFTHNIVSTFCGVFEKVDEKTRQAMFKLRTTWNDYFPSSKLHALDAKVNSIDPAWPIMAPPQQPTIHVNPKFIKKTDAVPVVPMTQDPAVVSSAPIPTNDALLQRQAEQEKQEALMRQQLIAKQHELLQLQQKKLEMELLQTKSRIEEQTRDLEVKKQELQQQSFVKRQVDQPQILPPQFQGMPSLQPQAQPQQLQGTSSVQHLHPATHLQSQQPQHLQLQQEKPQQQPKAPASSTRDPRVRDPRRNRDPRMGTNPNTWAKVSVPAVQEITQEFSNSPKGSPVYDSQRASPSKDKSGQRVPSPVLPADNKRTTRTDDTKATVVKPTKQYRKQDKGKPQNHEKDSRTDLKGKSSNNVKSDSKREKKDTKSDERKDPMKKKGETTEKKSEKDRKPIIKKDSDPKSSDKNDKKKDKPREKKVEIKEDNARSSGSRRNSAEDRKKSRSLSPKRSRSKSPLRTGSRSPRSRGTSPKTDRHYRDRSPLRRNRRDRIRDNKDERRGRIDDKSRKENEKKDEGMGDLRKYPDERFGRRRPVEYAGPDHLPPKKRPRMGRGQENTWDDRRKPGWGDDRPWSRPPGRRPLERRVSLDPDVKIPKELTLIKQKEILEQAERQLHSGTLSHDQHQDLLRQLNDLYQLQRIKKEERVEPVIYTDSYNWPVRDYDARRDTDIPQTYFKEMERMPMILHGASTNNSMDVDERSLDGVIPMQSDPKGFTHLEDDKDFDGITSSKGDVDMRELPVLPGQSLPVLPGQSQSYPPPLMSIPVRPPVQKGEDNSQTTPRLDDKDQDSPLHAEGMFGSTDQDMRTLDSGLPFGPGMKDKDMRQEFPEAPEQVMEGRETIREGRRPPREGPRAIRGGHRHAPGAPRQRPEEHRPEEQRLEEQRPVTTGPKPGLLGDGPKPMAEEPKQGPLSRIEVSRLMIEESRSAMDAQRQGVDEKLQGKNGPRPTPDRPATDGPKPMVEDSKPMKEGPRPMMKGPHSMVEGPRPGLEGQRVGMDGPRPGLNNVRPGMDVSLNMRRDGPRMMMEGVRPMMEGPVQRMNMPMVQPNMGGPMMRGPGPHQRMPMMNMGMPQQQNMPMNIPQMMPMNNQQTSQPMPMMNQQQLMASIAAAPMMQQLTMSMLPLAQQLPQMQAAMQMRANMPNMGQGFPMGGPMQGMMNFGMRGPMPMTSMPQHVMQQQQQPGGTATPPPPQGLIPPQAPQQPPQEHVTTQVDVNSLFAKLLSAGIISKTGNNSPRPEGTETPPPHQQTSSQETMEDKKEDEPEEEEEVLVIPEIGFYPEELKVRFQGVINRIYNGIQCSSCGLRFMPEEMDKYAKHLDWHFRLNRREKDGAKKATSRKWYYKLDDWIKFEEIDELEEGARSEFFELQARLGLTEMLKKPDPVVSSIAVTGDNDTEEVCDICQEKFDQFWDEDEEQWQLKDAIRVDGKTYHPLCYEDTKDVALETPTPIEELEKPAFPVLSNGGSVTTTIKSEPVEQELESKEQNITETPHVTKTEAEGSVNIKVEVKQEDGASN